LLDNSKIGYGAREFTCIFILYYAHYYVFPYTIQYFIVFMKGRSHQRYIFKVILRFCINLSGLERFQSSLQIQIVNHVTAFQTTFSTCADLTNREF